jgi:hypothetical protein
MGLSQSILFYGTVGVAVAVAVYVRADGKSAAERLFVVSTAVLFWPLYLPLLLARAAPPDAGTKPTVCEVRDEMSAAIARVEAELDAAFSSLDGWAEDVLAREMDRIGELRSAWNAQAARVREMDRLLAEPEFAAHDFDDAATGCTMQPAGRPDPDLADRRRQSELARRKNVDRLRQVRRQAHDDLMGTLAWVRELVSMIHLAKFTGAPASRAEELVAQIAAAVEGVSAVTWGAAVEEVEGGEGVEASEEARA